MCFVLSGVNHLTCITLCLSRYTVMHLSAAAVVLGSSRPRAVRREATSTATATALLHGCCVCEEGNPSRLGELSRILRRVLTYRRVAQIIYAFIKTSPAWSWAWACVITLQLTIPTEMIFIGTLQCKPLNGARLGTHLPKRIGERIKACLPTVSHDNQNRCDVCRSRAAQEPQPHVLPTTAIR